MEDKPAVVVVGKLGLINHRDTALVNGLEKIPGISAVMVDEKHLDTRSFYKKVYGSADAEIGDSVVEIKSYPKFDYVDDVLLNDPKPFSSVSRSLSFTKSYVKQEKRKAKRKLQKTARKLSRRKL